MIVTGGRDRRTHVPSGSLCLRALSVLHVGLVFVENGEPVWANRAAVSLLGDVGAVDDQWREVAGAAVKLRPAASPRSVRAMRSLGTLRTPAGRLNLCGVHLPSTRGTDMILVAVEPSARGPAGDAHLRHRYGLTPQELHVARLLAEGLRNAQLAVALGITPNTARIHTERVMRKLGVHSRAAVASVLLRA